MRSERVTRALPSEIPAKSKTRAYTLEASLYLRQAQASGASFTALPVCLVYLMLGYRGFLTWNRDSDGHICQS